MASALEIIALTKTFRGRSGAVRALNDVSLAVERGEMIALIGVSGSGKSTLLRHVCGLSIGDRRSGEGMVRVFGETIQQNGRLAASARRTRAGIGVIFQQFNLVGRLSLLTNVLLGALGHMPAWRATLGLFNRREKLRALESLQRVGIADLAHQRASTLSGGQQQRAAIARALVQESRVILADEPIASLDPESANRVMDHLARINREDGVTIIVALHQIDFAVRYCPRAVAMRNGRIVFDGPSASLNAERLLEIFGAASAATLGVPMARPLADERLRMTAHRRAEAV